MDSLESPNCPLLLSPRLDYKSTANILGDFPWHVLYFLVLYRQYFTRNFFLLEVMREGSSVLWGTNQLRRFFCSVRNKPQFFSLHFYVSQHVLMIPIPHALMIPLFLPEPTCSHDPSSHYLGQKHREFYVSLHGLTLSLMFTRAS
jgi:hypothetical protein